MNLISNVCVTYKRCVAREKEEEEEEENVTGVCLLSLAPKNRWCLKGEEICSFIRQRLLLMTPGPGCLQPLTTLLTCVAP